MKGFLVGLISLVVLLFAAVLIAPSFYDWNQYKDYAVKTAKDQAGLDIKINGDIKMAVLPSPHAYVSDVVVKSVGNSKYENLVAIKRLDLNLALAPLLSGKVDFTSIDLVSPQINIETYADGSQNWQSDKIKALQDNKTEEQETKTSALDKISLGKFNISDASINLYDAKAKSEQSFKDINLNIRADSLSAGPFYVEGDMDAMGKKINIDAKTGRMDSNNGSVALKVVSNIQPDNIKIDYAGVVGFKEKIDAQGELKLAIDDLKGTLGSMGVDQSSVLSSKLTSEGLFTFSDNQFSYKNAMINVGNQTINGAVSGTTSPMKIVVDLKSSNFDLTKILNLPNVPQTKVLSITSDIQMVGDAIVLKNSKMQLDETKLSGDITYEPSRARPYLKVAANSDYIDLNKFIPVSSNSKQKTDIKQTLKSVSVPVDVDFDVDVKEALYGSYKVQGLDAQGSLKNNGLSLGTFKVQNFADMAIDASGVIQNIQSLEGVDLKTSVSSSDIKRAASLLNIDLSGFPADINKASFSGQFKGNASAMDTIANVKALNGEVVLSGILNDALGAFSMNNMDVQLKHRNVNEALNIASPGMGNFENMNKPLDFYAKVRKTADTYSLESIKADIAGNAVAGNASITMGQIPKLTGDFQLGDIVVQGTSKAGSASSGGWSQKTMSSSWMKMVDFDVKASAKSIDYQGWKMAAPKLQANLQGGTLQLSEFNGGMYDGQIYLIGDLKPASEKGGYAINGDAKLRGVSMEPLVQSFAGNKILKGSGLVNLDTNIATTGLSASALVNALSGKGVLSGENIILDGVDLARFARAMSEEGKIGDSLLGVWKGTTKGGSTQFDTMDGAYTISNGIVDISSLKMDGPKAYLNTTGKIDLPKFTIATAHEITVKDTDIPSFTMKINGPLNNPAQTFGQGALNDYLSRKVNRKLGKVISDKVDGDLGNALGSLLGGTPKKQAQPEQVPANDNATEATPVSDDGSAEQAPINNVQEEPAAEEPKEVKPEEALEGLIKGLLQ